MILIFGKIYSSDFNENYNFIIFEKGITEYIVAW